SMSGIVTVTMASVDQMVKSIGMLMAITTSVILAFHWVFDVVPAANAPANARVQQRKTSTAVNRHAANQTTLAHSTLPCAHTALSGLRPIGDTVRTLKQECC